jgi:hypothetical protein
VVLGIGHAYINYKSQKPVRRPRQRVGVLAMSRR